ncbi:MAG: ATP-binding protein [Reyranella sp.]|nr:ATP-binding protein [Reyranella sp.]
MKAPSFLRRGGLFAKYFLSLVGIVTLVLLINGAFDMWFAYGTARQALGRLQQEQANGAADKVGQFITEIERQIGWTTHPQWAAAPVDQRRFDFIRLQRQVPAITELTQIDGQGREQLKVSRLAMDVVGSNTDLSKDPRFAEVQDKRVWYSPVYLRKESEPYMSISLARTGRRAGATAAEVNLKLIWDVVSAIKAGDKGYAYVVDRDGRLIAHPDISLVLRNTNMSKLEQVHTALDDLRDGKPLTGASARFGHSLDGTAVLSSVAAIPALGWLVFVEQPTSEALQPLFTSLWQTLALLVLGLATAAIGAWFLSRRMASPIRVLSAGAERLGGGDLGHRIEVRTGDEVEALATNFNRMAGQLQESHATLEQRVVDRTRELTETLEQQTATAEILRVISQSPTDVAPVMQAVARAAVRFCGAEDAHVFLREGDEMVSGAHEGPLSAHPLGYRDALDATSTARAQSIIEARVTHIVDTLSPEAEAAYTLIRENSIQHGFRAQLNAPMLRDGRAIGCICLRRREPGAFTPRQIQLLEAFAAQAVIAIENVRLFTELRESLEQQTASSEILQVISQSPTDVQPVLDVVVSAARRFCGATDALITRREGDEVVFAAHDGSLTASLGSRRSIEHSAGMGRSIIEGRTIHIPDVAALDPIENATTLALAREHKWRASISAPMLREGIAVGAITLRKMEVGAFTPRQIELVETFAAQAVIAIENVRLFTEIQEKSRQLEVASQHKSQFLANMSHELRTPLNAIIGYTEMMADGLYGKVGEKAQGVLERVQNNGRHLLGLINDVLDLSKIEAGQLTLAVEPYSVADMVATVLSATESLARTKGLALGSAVAPGLPTGSGDARRLTQVLLNLVGNAIKFTDSGSVEVRAARTGDCFELSVVDSGFGIAPADQARIFDEFQQVDNSSTRKKGGTGLGLSISRKIVELHGGRISVESEVGKGSTFKATIPINVAPVEGVAKETA